MRQQIAPAREQHERDLAEGFGEVWLPFALAEKYPAVIEREFGLFGIGVTQLAASADRRGGGLDFDKQE